MGSIYKNRYILNQRGGSIDIDNTTDREKIKISQRSGSNINLTNVANIELATNNKQTNTINDSFETVGNDKSIFVGKDSIQRVGKNSYNLKGFISKSEIDAFKTWKDTYETIAKTNSEFKILRGGISNPNGQSTELIGSRSNNPVIDSKVFTVENTFNGYSGTPLRKSDSDEVVTFSKVIDYGKTLPASERVITMSDLSMAAGAGGSNAPGFIEFGSKNPATENGSWSINSNTQNLENDILDIQDILTPIEQQMGDGGDETNVIKRNKFEQVGAVFNDYPSIRIDPKGRSQPFEMLVGGTGTFKNHDSIPHIEEVDNSSTFPCGNDDKVVGNRYSRTVGSGGIQLKTTGSTEMGGTQLKVGFNRVHINASHGVQIASEEFLELQSLKTITLRTNRQVYVESSLGVKGNLIVGGGAYIEGETYIQHITAPLEVHQTENTILTGKFATTEDRKLLIGEAHIGDRYYPVYAMKNDDLIVNYPHSHHHNGIPMRLMKANSDVRKIAGEEGINTHNNIAQSLPQVHERKVAN